MRPSTPCRRFVQAVVLLLGTMVWHADAVGGQLSLTWVDNAAGEAGFLVERGPAATGPFTEIAVAPPGVTTLTDTGLADAATYCYRVRAFSLAEYSAFSNVACASTPQVLGLAVVRSGTGTGTVISTPAGIICGSSCSGSLPGRYRGDARGHPGGGRHLCRVERRVRRHRLLHGRHEPGTTVVAAFDSGAVTLRSTKPGRARARSSAHPRASSAGRRARRAIPRAPQ